MLPRRSFQALSITVGCVLSALAAPAAFASDVPGIPVQAVSAPVEVTILQTVNLPWQAPEVIVKNTPALDNMHVELVIDASAGPGQDYWHVPADTTHSLTWRAAAGRHRCDVRISGMQAGVNFRQVFTATVDVVPPLDVKLTAADVDAEQRQLQLRSQSELTFAELTIYDVDGHVLHQATTTWNKDEHGKPLIISWPELTAPAAKIAVRAFNSADTWADVEWTPIRVEVPHEPIFLQDVVNGGERTKFAGAYKQVIEALRAHSGVPGLRLYVLGVTRVPDQATPAAQRARELAAYFQEQGGVGLPVLSGSTVDPEEEAANGRVQAILSIDDPVPTLWIEAPATVIKRPRHSAHSKQPAAVR